MKWRYHMRKSAAVIPLVLLLALMLAGCGEQTGQAEQYMDNADKALEKVEPIYSKMVQDTVTLALDYAEGTSTEPAGVKAKLDAIEKQLAEAKSGTERANREFEKIYKLEGVHDFKEYALVQAELIDLLNATRTTVSEIVDIVKTSSDTGQPPDANRLNRLAGYLGLLSLRAGEVRMKADELKKLRDI
ncbi:MAG: hypothetical protein V1748_11645 [Actinomycetota bacterium]